MLCFINSDPLNPHLTHKLKEINDEFKRRELFDEKHYKSTFYDAVRRECSMARVIPIDELTDDQAVIHQRAYIKTGSSWEFYQPPACLNQTN